MPADKNKKSGLKLWAAAFWLIVWQAASMIINNEIAIVSPVNVIKRLFVLIFTGEFWTSVLYTSLRISAGFFLGVSAGIILSVIASRFKKAEELLAPLLIAVKAVPVASFIILVLILFTSRCLTVLISFLMVLPVTYSNMLEGIRSADKNLLEMADVFKIPAGRKIRYIYISQIFPYFKSACAVTIGMSWKSGVAAELIGIPTGSIGEKLHDAKVYFDTPDLFAWTLVIVILSITFEKIFEKLLSGVEKWTVSS